jgi:CHAT domain-containing protein
MLAGDSRLSLSKVIRLSLPHAEVAFFSACQTATGAEDLSEEAVYLAAGVLLAGYQGVIATMWSIQDSDGPIVADDVYSHLFKHSQPDATQAAYALHMAAQKLYNEPQGTKSFFSWVPFIHIGI